MSDTPRTDALLKHLEENRYNVFEAQPHLQELARSLERELSHCKAAHAALVQMAGGPPLPSHSTGSFAQPEVRRTQSCSICGQPVVQIEGLTPLPQKSSP